MLYPGALSANWLEGPTPPTKPLWHPRLRGHQKPRDNSTHPGGLDLRLLPCGLGPRLPPWVVRAEGTGIHLGLCCPLGWPSTEQTSEWCSCLWVSNEPCWLPRQALLRGSRGHRAYDSEPHLAGDGVTSRCLPRAPAHRATSSAFAISPSMAAPGTG